MELREAEIMYQVEMDHFWFIGTRLALAAFLSRLPERLPGPVLDVGCGTGAVVAALGTRGATVAGLDFLPVCLKLARRRTAAPLIRGRADALPVKDGSLGLITCLDVLSHGSMEVAPALAEFHRALAPGGYLMIFDTAYPGLLGSHDAAFHETRRFTRPGLRLTLERHGFTVVRASYRNTSCPAHIALRSRASFTSPARQVRAPSVPTWSCRPGPSTPS